MDIQDALDKYVLQLRADGRSTHTIQQYRRHLRLFDRWLDSEGRDQNIESIDHEVVALFMISDEATRTPKGETKRATSMNALRSSLRTFFGYLHAAGMTTLNASRLLRRARCGTPPPRALTEDEQDRLLKALEGACTPTEHRDLVLFTLLLATGIRIGSALGLDVEDVDLDADELWLRSTKNDRPDRVFLPPATAKMMKNHLHAVDQTSGPLIVGRGGRRLGTRHVQRRLARWCEVAKIRRAVSPHSLRHTFGQRLYESTSDLGIVQAALHHRSILSTMVYAGACAEQVRSAISG